MSFLIQPLNWKDQVVFIACLQYIFIAYLFNLQYEWQDEHGIALKTFACSISPHVGGQSIPLYPGPQFEVLPLLGNCLAYSKPLLEGGLYLVEVSM